MWTVMRHGGRRTDTWRCVYEGADEAQARRLYDRELSAMRQGHVLLAGPQGVVRHRWAARCRTGWREQPGRDRAEARSDHTKHRP